MHRLGQYGVSIICVPSSWNIKFNLHISHFCFDRDGGEGAWEIIYVFYPYPSTAREDRA